ncbi:MAG: hypothetical protein RLY13_370 [Actinomycetota bacterium]|jgi:hypothetical protein
MRKIAPAAFLTAGFLVFGGLLATPAFADDEEDSEEKTTLVSPKPIKIEDREDHDEDEEEVDENAKHQELREKYGDNGKLMLPPLVIRPKHRGPKPTPAITSSPGTVSTGSVGAGEIAEDEAESGSFEGASLGGFIAVNPSKSGTELANDQTGKSVNPVQNAPIEISTVNYEQKTPVAVFIDAAKVGLGVMLVGVLALGLVAGYRAIRHK